MNKLYITFVFLIITATIIASGCTGLSNNKGTAYIAGYEIKYKVDDEFTTFIVHGPSLPAATMTFKVDGYENVTVIPNGTTEYKHGIHSYGLNYVRFMIWPKKYATSSYADTYYYNGCSIMSYNGWNFKCNHPITIFGRTVVATAWSPYGK